MSSIIESKNKIESLLKNKKYSFENNFEPRQEEKNLYHQWSFDNRDDMDFFLQGIAHMQDLKEFVIDEEKLKLYCFTMERESITQDREEMLMRESDDILNSVMEYTITHDSDGNRVRDNNTEKDFEDIR